MKRLEMEFIIFDTSVQIADQLSRELLFAGCGLGSLHSALWPLGSSDGLHAQ